MGKFKNWLIKKLGGYSRKQLDEYIQIEKDRVETKYESILRDKEKEFSEKLKNEVEKAMGTMKVVDVPCGTETIQLVATIPYGFPKEKYNDILEQLKYKIPDKFFDVQTWVEPSSMAENFVATIMVANPKNLRKDASTEIRTMIKPPRYYETE